MEANKDDNKRTLSTIDSVPCLGCGAIYAKPAGGGTVKSNSGCPECGYVGWVPATSRFTPPEFARTRFFSGHQRRRSA